MRIEINEPQAIWETGQQAEQQNSIYPPKGEADQADRIFIVSDGHFTNGFSSKDFVKNVSGYFKRYRLGSGEISDDDIISSLNTCLTDENRASAQGLSFVMVCIHPDGVTVASAGNCHVMQIRPSSKKVVFQISGSEKASVANPAISHLEDIEPGDYFVVFTNGLLEQTDTNAICTFFSEEGSDDKKRNMLRSMTAGGKANHSAYFFKVRTIVSDDGKELTGRHNIIIPDIKSVKPVSDSYDDEDDDDDEVVTDSKVEDEKPSEPAQKPKPVKTPEPARPRQTNTPKHQPRPISQYEEERKSTNIRMVVLVAVIVVLAIAAGALWYFNSSSTKNLPADSTMVETPASVDTTKQQTAEPADSAMIPDTAIAEPERNIPVTPKKIEHKSTEEKSSDEAVETEPTETESTEAPADHKTEAEPEKTKTSGSESPSTEKAAGSQTAE